MTRLVAMVLTIGALLGFGFFTQGASGRQEAATPNASPVASPMASPVDACAGVGEYMAARARILLEREDRLRPAANPGSLGSMAAARVSEAMAEIRDGIAALLPPPALADYHTASVRAFDLHSRIFATIASSGLAEATSQISEGSAAVNTMLAAEATARALCEAQWVTLDMVSQTPTP